jgi:ribosomal protein S12 methylthiotransferase accessory factor
MTSRPRLDPQYHAVIVEGRGALLLSDRGDRALSGRLFERLIPLLDGAASSADLATWLEPEHSPAEVFYTLSLLEAQGFLTSEAAGATAGAPAQPPVSRSASGQPAAAAAMVILGALPTAACLAGLQRQALRRVDTAPVTLVLTDSYLRPELAALDAEVRAAGGVWLPARLARDAIWIGPVFRPGSGPCWQCLEHRLRRNRPLEYNLLRDSEGVRSVGSTIPGGAALDTAITMVAGACAAAIQQPSGVEFADAILAIELPRGIRRRHPTARRPQCSACGDGAAYAQEAEAPIVLAGGLKRSTTGGGHRDMSPEETLARFDALVDSLTGVVQSVELVPTAAADVVRVCVARFGADPKWETGPMLGRGLRQSGGKGMTEAEARASSLGEAIERYSWAYQGDEPRRLGSADELGADAIHPNDCMLFSDAQYAARATPGARASRWHLVPPPLDPRARIDWTPVWSLGGQCRRYLPTMLLYGGYPSPPERAYCIADPSGSAAGNSREEAVLQGLLELVERDALSIWWYNRIRRSAIALDGIDDPSVRRLVSRYERQGRTVWALDLTTDLGIPVVAAGSRRIAGAPEAILLGFGAHLDPTTALTRALLELAQIDVQVACAEREGRALDPTLAGWLRDATVGNQPYLEPASGAETAPAELPRLATDDLRDDIGLCQQVLARAGSELLLLDQTRPDIGVPVVKVLAPGLRHFRPRLAPGRLYDVPVRLGWLAEARAEGELNPIPFFL